MLLILLTKDQGAFLGPISNILGHLMNGIFAFLDFIHIPNIGLAIFLFTIVIYLCMLPLTIKQQKFSKLSVKMNPELQVIRDRYKNKKDNESMQAMNAETQQVYAKYGVSQTGSCVQLIIQMPILFALYRVISNIPAYVDKVKAAFSPLVDNLIVQEGSAEFIQGFKNASMYTRNFNEVIASGNAESIRNNYIDILNKASSSELQTIINQYPSLEADVQKTAELIGSYNNFLGINIGNSPSFMVTEAWNAVGGVAWLALFLAFLIPVLSAVTQWINVKLMPQQAQQTTGDQSNSMMQSMKMMNTMMPLISAFFCYTLPAGMGLYWIAGSVVRSIQQVIINRHLDKIDLEELIKKNVEKRNKKLEKAGIDPQKINTYASLNTRNVVPSGANASTSRSTPEVKMTQEEKEEALRKSTAYYTKNAKPGSIAAKANMVKQYNEKNNK